MDMGQPPQPLSIMASSTFSSDSLGSNGLGVCYDGTSAPPSERLTRMASTATVSVSEFYGPQGARALQRRGSTASALSFAESYPDSEMDTSRGGGREELRDSHEAAYGSGAGPRNGQHAAAFLAGSHDAKCAVASSVALNGNAAPEHRPGHGSATGESSQGGAVAWPGVRGASNGAGQAGYPHEAASSAVSVMGPSAMDVDAPSETCGATPAVGVCNAGDSVAAAAAAASKTEGAMPGANGHLLPPPLTLEAPHPGAIASTGPATLSGARVKGESGHLGSAPLPGDLLPSVSPPPGDISGGAVGFDGSGRSNGSRRDNHLRAMSVDSATAPPRDASMSVTRARTASVGALPAPPLAQPPAPGTAARGLGSLGECPANGTGSAVPGKGAHSPRLRAKSMDSKRKGKTKRGKGPGTTVVGKADRIGRMLQVRCRRARLASVLFRGDFS